MQCDKQFTLESSLRRHICDVHRDERDLTCEECGRKFTRLSVLQRHKQAIHGSHRFMCPYEGCEHPGYKYSQSLNEHIRSVHTHVRPYVCETCGKAFVSRKSLRQHSLTHLSENAFQERRYIICEECGGKFGNRCGLRRHKQAVHENHRFMCPYEGCNHPGYKRSQSITEHIRSVHTHDRPYVCEACGKAFVAGNRLRAHSCKHASENAFNPATNLLDASSSADVFGNDVSPHDRLLSEEERVLKILQAADVIIRKEDEKTSVETPKRHVKCDKQSASELEKHHFTCDECGGKFYSQSGLRRHNQATQENQLFMCPYEGCGHSGFKYNQALTKHIRSVHANVRSHVCKTCGEAFSTSCHLRSHYARHFFERKFQCKCGFWFRNEETLTRHERLCLLS
ncbi:hypothetical protein KIN20_025452 [Parelaphostrongylus tenuis]|uniref:C2H2-type domain-containing protein n=1 Tax=Parelaphostrongylus tenuis TaxID=148309 RepID=A0AAD5MYG4_PARTN|nr:hypothetical protein KIN20_025452 [Parelaphostrongylus tenuis]